MLQTAEQHTDQQAPDQHAQDAQYYRRVLQDLIDIGADLARLVHQQARAQAETTQPAGVPGPETSTNPQNIAPSPVATPDPTIAFERIARAIRRTVLLARTLNEPVPAKTEPDHRTAARKRIIRAVEDTIQRKAKGDEAERLHGEFLDRLDEPDLDDDIASRPVGEIIEDICRDLGVNHMPGTHPWKRRTPADIAVLAARAARAATRTPPEAAASSVIVEMRPCQRTLAGKTTDPP